MDEEVFEKQFTWDSVTWLRFGPSDVSALVTKLVDESGNATLHATTKLQQVKCFWRSKWGNRHRRKVRRRKDALTAEQKKERVKARRDKFLFGKKTTRGHVLHNQRLSLRRMTAATSEPSEKSCFGDKLQTYKRSHSAAVASWNVAFKLV